MQRVLVINPNSSEAVTAAIDLALEPLRREGGPVLQAAGLAEGPPGIATQGDSDSVIAPLTRWVQREDADAFVVACFSDPGLHSLREAAGGRPVLGIAESAILHAMTRGERFGIVALSPASVTRQRRYVRQMGLSSRYSDSWPVGTTAADSAGEAIGARMIEAGRALVERCRADVLILGCAGMARHCAPMRDALGVPVIEPSQAGAAAAVAALLLP